MVNTRRAAAAAAAAAATKRKSQTSISTSRPSRKPKVLDLQKPKLDHRDKLNDRSTPMSNDEDTVMGLESKIASSEKKASKFDPKTVTFWEKDNLMSSQTSHETIVSVSTQRGELQSAKTVDLEASKKHTDPELSVVAEESNDAIEWRSPEEWCAEEKRIGRAVDRYVRLLSLETDSPQIDGSMIDRIIERVEQGDTATYTCCGRKSESKSSSEREDSHGWARLSFDFDYEQ